MGGLHPRQFQKPPGPGYPGSRIPTLNNPLHFFPSRAGRHDAQNTAHLRKIPVDLLFLADILKGPRAVLNPCQVASGEHCAGLRESLFNVLFRPVSKSPFF